VQREFNGKRSQRSLRISGDIGFDSGEDWAPPEPPNASRRKPAEIKLKTVFKVVFIGNIPNSTYRPHGH
jgi:hypothetical protein